MSSLTFCDVCGKPIIGRDLRYIKLEDKDGKPKMHDEEICPECGLAIKLHISKLKESHATVSHRK